MIESMPAPATREQVLDIREKTILDNLNILFSPGDTIEIRILNKFQTVFGYFRNFSEAARQVYRYDESGEYTGIYVTLNQVSPDLYYLSPDKIQRAGKSDTTSDIDIIRRVWLLIDADPERISGIPATDAEKAHALDVITRCKAYLDYSGFSEPLFGDSGNGYHLLYRIDLPNDEASKELIKNLLLSLNDKFELKNKEKKVLCSIDTGVFNASRISKLYGTIARKGGNTQDRPHRRSSIISVPDEFIVNSEEILRSIVTIPETEEATVIKTDVDTKEPVSYWFDKWQMQYDPPIDKGDNIRYNNVICPFCEDRTGYSIQYKDTGKPTYYCHHENHCVGTKKNSWSKIWLHFEPDLENPYQRAEKKTRDKANDEDEEPIRHLPYFERDGKLFLTCISRDETYHYASLQDGKIVLSEEEYDSLGVKTVPPSLPKHQDTGVVVYLVGLPQADLLKSVPLLSAKELYNKLKSHFYKYFDAPDTEYELCVYYSLFTWFFSKCQTSPYFRLIADTGKGKSRILRVVSDVCFLPLKASGSSSLSGIMRAKERWNGTLLVDEGDLKGDQSDPLVKYLNLGFEKDNYFLLTDKNDLSKSHVFHPFGPKVIAMRQPFRDAATEGRCLSFSPSETTRNDIPPELPKKYFQEVDEIRALICRFIFEHWQTLDEEKMLCCDEFGIEARLKQMARPVSIILQLFPDGEERFITYLKARQLEIKQTRADSWEGSMFNYALRLATGEESLINHPEHYKYYSDGKIVAVIPKMISENIGTSTNAVTRALSSIGMQVRQKRITTIIKTGDKETTKSIKIRRLQVPNTKKWQEILQRYYYSEDQDTKNLDLECPSCLMGDKYERSNTSKKEEQQQELLTVCQESGTTGTNGTDDQDHPPDDEKCTACTACTAYSTQSDQKILDHEREKKTLYKESGTTGTSGTDYATLEDLKNSGNVPWLPKTDSYKPAPPGYTCGTCQFSGCNEPVKWLSHGLYPLCDKHFHQVKLLEGQGGSS